MKHLRVGMNRAEVASTIKMVIAYNISFRTNFVLENIQFLSIGSTQTYQFSQMTRFGTSYKVLHEVPINDTQQRKKTGRCLSERGTEEFPIFPQDILPDLSNFTVVILLNKIILFKLPNNDLFISALFQFNSIQDYGKNKAQYWVYQYEKGDIITKHGMWLIRKVSIYFTCTFF